VAQAAVKVAHLEENALLRAGELAAGAALELLGQVEAWNRRREEKTPMKSFAIGKVNKKIKKSQRSSPAVPVLLVDMW